MNKSIVLGLCFIVMGKIAVADDCHPSINTDEQNFIVGYGSLMNDKSRQRTNPKAINVYPIEVRNFERNWGLRASGTFRTTALLVVPKRGSSLNAVYYPVDSGGVEAADAREVNYCRYKIPAVDVKSLGLKNLQRGDYWIYASELSDIKKPTKEFPIIQSYVDLFVEGCMQIQDRYLVDGFVEQCVKTTKYWDNNAWVNDRVNARRPTDSKPNARNIDEHLAKYLGKGYYDHGYD